MKTFTAAETRGAKALFEYQEGAGIKGDRWDNSPNQYIYQCRARIVLDATNGDKS